MLVTGVLLVPIGIVLLGVAMRSAPTFGARSAVDGIGSARWERSAPSSQSSIRDRRSRPPSVLAIVMFYLTSSWRTLAIEAGATTEFTHDDTARPD